MTTRVAIVFIAVSALATWFPLRVNAVEIDLNSVLPLLELVGPESNEHLGVIHTHDIRKEALTSKELLLVSDLNLDGQKVLSCSMALGAIAVFYQENGRLPEDGLDILNSFNPRLASEEHLVDEADTLTTLLTGGAGLWRCVNPATGKLFDTFSNRQWHQYGVFVEEDPMTRLIPVATFNPKSGEHSMELTGHKMFRVIVFGEEPGSVLVDKEIGVIWNGSPEPSSPCSCGVPAK